MLSDAAVYGQAIITEFLENIRLELIAYMDANNRNASGRSKNSLQVVNVTGDRGQLIGADWIEFTFRGRGPGKMPPLSHIIDWCVAKGLPRSMAWIIAKRISESGTKLYREGRNIITETITPEKINALTESISRIYVAQIESDINSILAA